MRQGLKGKLVALVFLYGSTTLGGCELDRGGRLNFTAPSPPISNDELKKIDVAALVGARVCDGKYDSYLESSDKERIKNFCDNLDISNEKPSYRAFAAFYHKYDESTSKGAKGMIARNAVQDAILGAADYNCVEMLDALGQGKMTKDVLMGAIGIATNAASVISSGYTARLWGTLSGGVLALDDKIDESILRQVAYGVLVSGIQMARAEIHNSQIRVNQQKSLNDYTLELAIKDAFVYANTCNTQVALEKVKENLIKNSVANNDNSYATKDSMIKRLERFNKDQMEKFVKYDTDENISNYSQDLQKSDGLKIVIRKYTEEILNAKTNAERLEKIRTMLRLID